MQIETYEVNETTSDGATDALDAEAVALCQRLGLKGQERLVSKAADVPESILPYQEMTAEELAVYEILFPEKDLVADYAAGPIPLRVLQVVAFAQERKWFDRIQVWHKRSGSAKEDPVLVGIIANAQHRTLDRQRFMLARWGDALQPFAALVKQAAIIARAKILTGAEKARNDIATALATIPTLSDEQAIAWAARGEPSASRTTIAGW